MQVPRALLADNSMDPRAKFLYMSIVAFKPKSIRELARRTGMNRSVVTNLAGSLREAQWLLGSHLTIEFLEYDCFAPDAKVAWEFNGRQHYETTPQLSDEIELKRIRERDLMNAQLSCEQGVTLITITPKYLNIGTMPEMLGR